MVCHVVQNDLSPVSCRTLALAVNLLNLDFYLINSNVTDSWRDNVDLMTQKKFNLKNTNFIKMTSCPDGSLDAVEKVGYCPS